MNINFKEEVLKNKDDLLSDLFELLKVRSILGTDITEETPVGSGPKEALKLILSFGERDGYKTKIVDNIAGHIEVGEGEEIFGILGHVDVVPVTESEWITPPFEPNIRDGKIYARGVLDDKGPTMAGYYAVKLLDKLGVKWKKRVRIIVGSDEETGFRCVDAYFKKEETPATGFTPDGHYPLIYGEKAHANYRYNLKFVDKIKGKFNIISFESGLVKNMVPSEAKVVLLGNFAELSTLLTEYQEKEEITKSIEKLSDENILITFKGKAAHGSTPYLGISAATNLAQFLNTLDLDNNGKNYVEFISKYLADDPYAKKLGLNYSDEEMGDATYNYGVLKYNLEEKVGFVETDSRYPKKFDLSDKIKDLSLENFDIDFYANKGAHYVPKEDELVQTLLSVYRGATGDMTEPMVIGGGTYARCLKKGVAFGALFPDREDTMHQANEYMLLDDLLLSTAIFAESIYKLCCEQ